MSKITIPDATPLEVEIKTFLDLSRLTYNISFNDIKEDVKKLGYSILEIKDDPKTGYFGIAYKKDTGKDKDNDTDQIIISHRGTDTMNLSKKYSTITDIADNIATTESVISIMDSATSDVLDDIRISLEIPLLQSDVAYEFVKKLQEDTKNKGAEIIQIGHSLGGYLAQYCYAKYGKTIKTYCFDAPGIEIMPEINSNIHMIPTFPIHYYMALGPNIVNCPNKHIVDDSSKFYKIFFPISQPISGISLFQYLKMTFLTHSNMLLPNNDFTFKEVDSWPSGFSNGLEYFFSKDNKDEWKILLDSYWKTICSELPVEDTEKNFDDFFDNYFEPNYLTPTKGKWHDVIPFQSFKDLGEEYDNTPFYYRPFEFVYEYSKSLSTAFQNYKSINEDLVEQYIIYYNNPRQSKPDQNFIDRTWDNIVKLYEFTTNGNYIPILIDTAAQKLGSPSGATSKYINDSSKAIIDNLSSIISSISNSYNGIYKSSSDIFNSVSSNIKYFYNQFSEYVNDLDNQDPNNSEEIKNSGDQHPEEIE